MAKKTINIIVDNSGPSINEVTQIPLIPCENESVTINALIDDKLSGVANVTLHYKIDDVWKSLTMFLSGNIWTATIPGKKAELKLNTISKPTINSETKP